MDVTDSVPEDAAESLCAGIPVPEVATAADFALPPGNAVGAPQSFY